MHFVTSRKAAVASTARAWTARCCVLAAVLIPASSAGAAYTGGDSFCERYNEHVQQLRLFATWQDKQILALQSQKLDLKARMDTLEIMVPGYQPGPAARKALTDIDESIALARKSRDDLRAWLAQMTSADDARECHITPSSATPATVQTPAPAAVQTPPQPTLPPGALPAQISAPLSAGFDARGNCPGGYYATEAERGGPSTCLKCPPYGMYEPAWNFSWSDNRKVCVRCPARSGTHYEPGPKACVPGGGRDTSVVACKRRRRGRLTAVL